MLHGSRKPRTHQHDLPFTWLTLEIPAQTPNPPAFSLSLSSRKDFFLQQLNSRAKGPIESLPLARGSFPRSQGRRCTQPAQHKLAQHISYEPQAPHDKQLRYSFCFLFFFSPNLPHLQTRPKQAYGKGWTEIPAKRLCLLSFTG